MRRSAPLLKDKAGEGHLNYIIHHLHSVLKLEINEGKLYI